MNSAAYDHSQWNSFFSTVAGASAGLTGLLFVAISINLPKVVASRNLVARALKALLALVAALLMAILCLAPRLSLPLLGIGIAVIGAASWMASVATLRRSFHKNACTTRTQRVVLSLLGNAAALPFLAGGISLTLQRGGGLYWLVAGMLLTFLAALTDAWVLLVEIHR